MSSAPQNADVTVALVHGAFADSSGWNDVVIQLHAAGVPVRAIPNPLRGIAHDSEYVAAAIRQIPGRVLAVGHSYGGAVISNASLPAGNVVGLVFVAGFAPDEGEVLQEVEAGSTDSVLNSVLVATDYPSDGESVPEFWIATDQFHDSFAADLSQEQAYTMAITQRPVSQRAFSEPNGVPAWKTLPSWAVVATGDRAAGTDVVRRMAERAGATIVEVDGSHVVMMSQPKAVAEAIQQALAALA